MTATSPMQTAPSAACARRAIVVVPSRTVDKWSETTAETLAYEERLLCLILGLRDPALHLVYVSSWPVAPAIVDSYLALLPRAILADARARLTMLSANETSQRPLTHKILAQPRLMRRLRRAIAGFDDCRLVPYMTTDLERDLAAELRIPMDGADPRHAHFGTKSGGRRLFAAVGIPHPAGREGLGSRDEAIDAIVALRLARPALKQLVMKLNEGVSGDGNAIVDLRGLPQPGAWDERAQVAHRVDAMVLEAAGVAVEDYLAKLAANGGIVEERITGDELRSPSVQFQITDDGAFEILSTHDQLLGGRSGQTYLGCRFPADRAYGPAIAELAARVAGHLAAQGVVGRAAIDFVVVADGAGGWRPYAIEINLRKGGTTHPFVALALLTGGGFDPTTGTFTAPHGARKHYVATDHLESPTLCALRSTGAISAIAAHGLGFDHARGTGVVTHMLSSLDAAGRMGFTAIADSATEAQWLYQHTCAVLLGRSPAVADAAPMAAAA